MQTTRLQCLETSLFPSLLFCTRMHKTASGYTPRIPRSGGLTIPSQNTSMFSIIIEVKDLSIEVTLIPWSYSSGDQNRQKQLLPDGSTGGLADSKALSLNLNFSFLNRFHYFSMEYSSNASVLTRLC